VAGAYRRLAEITGDSRGAHLGDPAGAQRLAERAAALLEAAQAREPGNIGILRERRILALLLGRLRLEAGDSGGVGETAKAVRIAEAITRLPDSGPADQATLGATLAQYGGILAVVSDDHPAAAVQLARAVEILEAAVRTSPRDTATRVSLAYAYERAAMAAEVSGDPAQMPRAIELQERAIATMEAVAREEPAHASHRQTLAKNYNNTARARLAVGDTEGARDMAARGRTLIESLAAEDPRNVGNASILAGAFAMASSIESRAGRHESAVAFARQAIAADARLPAETRAGLVVRENLNIARRSLGASACASPATAALPPARRAAVMAEAREALLESRAFKRELVKRGIDARDAAAAIAEIDVEISECARRG
jgi:tetratricopeptide (TPR) repeat protein